MNRNEKAAGTSFNAADVGSYQIVGTKGHIRVDPAYEYAEELTQTVTIDDREREKTFPQTDQFGGEIDHPTISEYVEAVGQRVVQQSDARRGPYQYDFHVLNDAQTINAFALPGGYVYITRGILPYLDDEAELAGVLVGGKQVFLDRHIHAQVFIDGSIHGPHAALSEYFDNSISFVQ